MEFFAIYAIIVTLCLVAAGVVLLLIDHYLEMRKIERCAAYAEYMIPEVGSEMKKLSIETVKEMNNILYKQFYKGESDEE